MSALFAINSTTGQISLASGRTLDYEDSANVDHEYEVTVTATDPSDEGDGASTNNETRASVTVTINVENVDETPIVTVAQTDGITGALDTGYKHNEPVGNNPTLEIPFAADDPELPGLSNTTQVEWTLTGTDADDFTIGNYNNTAGILTFKEEPDFEAPKDSNRNNVYDVIVQAKGRGRQHALE